MERYEQDACGLCNEVGEGGGKGRVPNGCVMLAMCFQ